MDTHLQIETTKAIPLRVRSRGRVVIPAELRRALNMVPGETLVARIKDGRLVLERVLRSAHADTPASLTK